MVLSEPPPAAALCRYCRSLPRQRFASDVDGDQCCPSSRPTRVVQVRNHFYPVLLVIGILAVDHWPPSPCLCFIILFSLSLLFLFCLLVNLFLVNFRSFFSSICSLLLLFFQHFLPIFAFLLAVLVATVSFLFLSIFILNGRSLPSALSRPLQQNIRLWQFTDLDNHLETLLLMLLTVLALIRATAIERLHREESDAIILQQAELPLWIAGTVIAFSLGIAYKVYYRREQNLRSVRYQAYREDVVVDAGMGGEAAQLQHTMSMSRSRNVVSQFNAC